MKVTLSTDAPETVRADLLAIGVRQGKLTDPTLRALDKAAGGAIRAHIALEDFKGKAGESIRVAVQGIGAAQVLLVGLGEGEASASSARTLGAKAGQAGSTYKSVAVLAPSEEPELLRALASGVLLGAYKYTEYLTGDRQPKRRLGAARVIVSSKAAAVRDAVKQGVSLGESVNLARDLVNAPPNDLPPRVLADRAKAEAKELGIDCKVWDKKGVEKLGMPLLLAVNRGSAEEPRFIHMTYRPKGQKGLPKVVFVGKGLTFDAGGLCLKPAKSMLDMKCDMAGAAVTLGVIVAAAKLGLPVEVHAIIGSTENMTGAAAYRPGDVFPSLDGKSVEIINTDAEGRLVLADALAYARNLEPDFMIDHATLTGACMVALGPWTAGLFTGDEELSERYQAAAAAEGESYWRMPLNDELREMLRSEIADLKHTGEAQGGAITAALFLREFAGDTRWMHVDIAGPSFQDRPHGVHPKGGTGFGVITAIRFLESLAG